MASWRNQISLEEKFLISTWKSNKFYLQSLRSPLYGEIQCAKLTNYVALLN